MSSRSIGRGLAKMDITTANTLVAFAAKHGFTASDGEGLNSPFTAALIDNMAIPGLDLRLALGRVRDEVMDKTGNKQEPFLYGSLGGATVSLVAAPADLTRSDALRRGRHRSRLSSIRMRGRLAITSWRYRSGRRKPGIYSCGGTPKGFYADLARAQRSKLATFEKDQLTRDRPQPPSTPQPERRTALPPPTTCPDGQRLEGGGCVADAPPAKYGAIAIGTKGNVWYGVVWSRDSDEDAKSGAMSGCLTQARKNKSTNCRVVHSFSDQCVALAWLNPGNGWGTAVRDTKAEAESAALGQCRSANPKSCCVLAGSWCATD